MAVGLRAGMYFPNRPANFRRVPVAASWNPSFFMRWFTFQSAHTP